MRVVEVGGEEGVVDWMMIVIVACVDDMKEEDDSMISIW